MDKKFIEATKEIIDAHQKVVRNEQQEFIDKVFDEYGGTVGLPDWLHSAAEEQDDLMTFCTIYGEYHHDGAWIRPYVMRREKVRPDVDTYTYRIDGRENEEYHSEWVYDIQVFYTDDIYQYLMDWFESGIPEQLDDLCNRLANCHRMGDVEIICEEWAEAHGYDYDELSWERMFEWYGNKVERKNNK